MTWATWCENYCLRGIGWPGFHGFMWKVEDLPEVIR